jgi:hypothetical protein
MKKEKLQKNRGFALLFAVTISAILLSVALGITSVAMKEIQFSTSAKDTNDAFFAADSGAEYVLYNDRSDNNSYPAPTEIGIPKIWNETVSGLGSLLQGCAFVTITKTVTSTEATTAIVSKGHNNGSPDCLTGSNTVERQLEINY